MDSLVVNMGSIINRRNKHSAGFKCEAIQYAKEYGNRAAAKMFGVGESSIREWKKNEIVISNMPKNKCALRKGGRKKAEANISDIIKTEISTSIGNQTSEGNQAGRIIAIQKKESTISEPIQTEIATSLGCQTTDILEGGRVIDIKKRVLPTVQVVEGRRIVDIQFLIKQLQKLCNHSSFGCTLKDMVLISERRAGFKSSFTFKCQVCSAMETISSDPEDETTVLPVNAAAVAGILGINGAVLSLQKFASAMNIPAPSSATFTKERRKIALGEYKVLSEDVVKAAAETMKGIPEKKPVNAEIPWEALKGTKVSPAKRKRPRPKRPPKVSTVSKKNKMVVELHPDSLLGSKSASLATPGCSTDSYGPTWIQTAPPYTANYELSKMQVDPVHSHMTCEVFPVELEQNSFQNIRIKEEPPDDETISPDIPFPTDEHLSHSSKDSSNSLFLSPVFVKEEPVTFEDET